MFGLIWEQFKLFLESAVPFAAQAALVYLIVRFTFAVAGLLLDLAGSAYPTPQPANNRANGPPQPQVAGQPARPGIPERASS